MITCVTYDNLDRTGAAFAAQFELRYRCFIERQGYDVRSYRGREYDQYDTPAAVYLVYEGREGQALGVSRISPVSMGCMIADLWPDMLSPSHLVTGNTWEGTRFCVERALDPAQRRRIVHELVLAYLEFGLARDIVRIIGVMQTVILRRVFAACGVGYQLLGEPRLIDGQRVQAAGMAVTLAQLAAVRRATGLYRPVLCNVPGHDGPDHMAVLPDVAQSLRERRAGASR